MTVPTSISIPEHQCHSSSPHFFYLLWSLLIFFTLFISVFFSVSYSRESRWRKHSNQISTNAHRLQGTRVSTYVHAFTIAITDDEWNLPTPTSHFDSLSHSYFSLLSPISSSSWSFLHFTIKSGRKSKQCTSHHFENLSLFLFSTFSYPFFFIFHFFFLRSTDEQLQEMTSPANYNRYKEISRPNVNKIVKLGMAFRGTYSTVRPSCFYFRFRLHIITLIPHYLFFSFDRRNHVPLPTHCVHAIN